MSSTSLSSKASSSTATVGRENQRWSAKAACRGIEAGVFYPISEEDALIAKSICSGCSAREDCLEFALTNRENNGVWGGSTERERRRMLRHRQRAARSLALSVDS